MVSCSSNVPGIKSQSPLISGTVDFNNTFLFGGTHNGAIGVGIYPAGNGNATFVYGYAIAAPTIFTAISSQYSKYSCIVKVTAPATYTLQWAQNTLSADTTTVVAGSYIVAEKLN